MKQTKPKIDHLFHPVEHAIISQWLGIETPAFAKNVDIHVDSDQLPAGVVGLEKDMYGSLSELAVSNAVARIMLSTVEHVLPQWAAFRGDKVIFGREEFNKHNGKVNVLPQFLFEINWATSGPGFPWPVAYHVGFLPYYDVYVVTSSADSPEAFGYTDLALDHFGADEDLLEGAKRIIQADWQHQFDEWEQQHWEALWKTGLISENQVEEMAEHVWGKPTQEEFYTNF
jgi:hypothetical protein